MPIDEKLTDRLKQAGLSDKEALIYNTLIEIGGAFPSKIAEITRLNRTTVYKILEVMSIKGLVSEVEKKKKFFYQAESPKNLERYVSSKMTTAKRELEHLQTILPQLDGLFANTPNKPIVRFYEGEEGVLAVYKDHINVGEKYEMLAFSNTADLMQFLSEDFRNSYIRRKAQLGITTRAILPDTEVDMKYNETFYANFPKAVWPKLRHVPRKMFPFKSDLTIYGKNKVSIINFNAPQFAATIIEDQIIHDLMVMIFELSWKGTGN
jgi:sugar-specific transcriptional regulator TrmB